MKYADLKMTSGIKPSPPPPPRTRPPINVKPIVRSAPPPISMG